MTTKVAKSKAESAIQFAQQAERLSLLPHNQASEETGAATAVEAKFITPLDNVIETANGGRLPAVPPLEAQKLNRLKAEVEGLHPNDDVTLSNGTRRQKQENNHESAELPTDEETSDGESLKEKSTEPSARAEAPLRISVPSSRTNPLFPPLPLYGPPTMMRNLHCLGFRISSFFLSLAFLGVIVLGSAFTSIPLMFRHVGLRLTFRNPNARRPFHKEEERRKDAREEAAEAWKHQRRRRSISVKSGDSEEEEVGQDEEYEPTEGGKDPLICDVGYYARRVGLDIEEFKVQTEDGFIITLWHVYNPKEYCPASAERRDYKKPEVFPDGHISNGKVNGTSGSQYTDGERRYPVLLIHGLLQSAGAYCANDDDSLAFYLCKRYDFLSNKFGQ